MNACIAKPHRAGLFSNINKVVTCLRMYDQVRVDWSEGSLYGDCWDDLFDYNLHPAHVGESSDIITDYPFYDLTAAMAGVLYQNEGWGWRQQCHEQWLKLKCKVQPLGIQAKAGVLVRSDGHRGEQLNDRSQSYEEYAQHINENDSVFLMATDIETREWFKKRFNVWWSGATVLSDRRSDPDRHLTQPQTKEDAIQVMREVLTLANRDYLVTPISNMATAALYINPLSKHIYLK